MKASHTVTPVFDDPNLVSTAGLVPVMRLAETAGLHDLLDERLSVDSPNPAAKTRCIVAGMLAGADSIDDLDLLRHGAMTRLFAGVRAPSTLGTYLRSFTHGHVQQLDAVAARLLAGLTDRVPDLTAGADEIAFLDVDDTIREVHGYSKQAAAFGYSGGPERTTGGPVDPCRGAGDRPGPSAARQRRLPHRRRTDARPGDRHRPLCRGVRADSGPRRLRVLRARVRRRRTTRWPGSR